MLTTRQLRAAGFTARAIDAAVHSGQLRRVRRGLYLPPTDERLVRAARWGALTCTSALAWLGVWTMPDHDLHVRVGADSREIEQPGIRLHRRGPAPHSELDSVLECVRQMYRCADDLAIVVALDSLLNTGRATIDEIDGVLGRTNRGRRILGRVDGRAESGIETIARVRLSARGVDLRPQVAIPGVGRVDLLVGDLLVIELDGRRWHAGEDSFESDRARDAALVVRGFLVLRYSYRRVMFDWDAVEAEVLSIVRRRRHVSRAGENRRPRP